MEKAQLCFGAALPHLAQGVLNLCRQSQDDQKAKCAAQCHRAWCQPQVIDPPTG